MRERSAVPGGKPAHGALASVDLVLLTLRDGELHALLGAGAGGGQSALPWGTVPAGTALESAARQVARGTAGQLPRWMEQGGAFNEGDHPGEAVVSICFVAVMPWREAPAGWEWTPTTRAGRRLAARQRRMLEAGLAAARARSEHAPVAFAMLAREFTLGELQQAYETLVGRRLHKASFRRALQGAWLVEPLEEWRSEGRGRPAQLFRYAPRRRGARRGIRFEVA